MLNLFKRRRTGPTIIDVVPVDYYKVYIVLSNSETRYIDSQVLGKEFSFLAFPNKLKAMTWDENQIVWKNGQKLDVAHILAKARLVGPSEIQGSLTLAQKNQAPTGQHKTHHVYYVSINPFSGKPVVLCESIGGGHGDIGGCTPAMSYVELLQLENWERHFILSGCDWAIEVIKSDASEKEKTNRLVAEVCARSTF
jgi:hypothetical protein